MKALGLQLRAPSEQFFQLLTWRFDFTTHGLDFVFTPAVFVGNAFPFFVFRSVISDSLPPLGGSSRVSEPCVKAGRFVGPVD